MPDPKDWKAKFVYRRANGKEKCATCDAFSSGRCSMFSDKVEPEYTCDEWTDKPTWRLGAWDEGPEDEEEPVWNITNGDEVLQGKALDPDDPDPGIFQWVPPTRTNDLNEALADLREGGYHWRVERGDEPQMWRLQHKREPVSHDISSRDLQLRGYNVYYNDPYLPRATGHGAEHDSGHYHLHDTTDSRGSGRIWATQRVDDLEDWQEPEPGTLNEPWIKEKFPKLWQQHWGSAIIGNDGWSQATQDSSQAGEAASSGGLETPEALRPPQAHVAAAGDYAWPSWEDVDYLSHLAVDNHQGYRDPEGLYGAVGNTQMAYQYGQHQDIYHTAADLFAKIQRQQAAVEGNKRTATAVMLNFLEDNGVDTTLLTDPSLEEPFVAVLYGVSAEGVGVEELAEFLRQHTRPLDQGVMAALAPVGVPFETYARFVLKGQWSDIQAKAKRLILEGKVTLLVNTPQAIVAHVIGDGSDNGDEPDEHEVEIAREDPDSNVITQSVCDCKWNQYRWDRTRKWKKFEGRVCAHILAAYWKSKATAIDITGMEPGTEYQAPVGQKGPTAQPGQLQIPIPKPTPMTHEPLVEEQATPAPTAQPLPSTGDLIGAPPQNPFGPAKQVKRSPKGVPQREQMQLFNLSPDPNVQSAPPAGGFSQPGQAPPDPESVQLPGTFSAWYPKTAMAERTGDPELDAALEEFAQLYSSYRRPEMATLQCQVISWELIMFLRKRGFQASTMQDDMQRPWPEDDDLWEYQDEFTHVDEIGYEDAEPKEFPYHCVVYVPRPSGTYMIDFTASQYGLGEFPMVQKLDNGGWQREF